MLSRPVPTEFKESIYMGSRGPLRLWPKGPPLVDAPLGGLVEPIPVGTDMPPFA